MKKFEIVESHREISYRSRKEIKPGCTLLQDDCSSSVLKSFQNKDEALAELKNYETEIRELSGSAGTYYLVTEYCVEENEYDEDGEWVSGGDVLEFSHMENAIEGEV
jgi:hypothetical protein